MLTIRQALATACDLDQVSDTARLDVEVLLAHVLNCDKSYLYTWPERELTGQQQQDFNVLIQERQRGVPVAYLVGEREFWSLPLEVSRSSLIPRPETELLVQLTLEMFAPDTEAKIADLGTGTGAVALAIASERADWLVLGCDRSEEIVALAERNRQALGLHNARFVVSNWCTGLPIHDYDLILSNPPYIADDDPHLDQGDVRFEPRSALVSGESGLADITKIAGQAKDYLKPNGYLLLEHGWEQAQAVSDILATAGYSDIQVHKDLAGCDRATQCRWPGGNG